MNNSQIIIHEAIESGYCTPEEIEQLLSEGKDIPFHTFSTWKKHGLVPKEGSHGWETRLWRRKKFNPSDSADAEIKNQGFFLQKSFLFHISQCEEIRDGGEVVITSVKETPLTQDPSGHNQESVGGRCNGRSPPPDTAYHVRHPYQGCFK